MKQPSPELQAALPALSAIPRLHLIGGWTWSSVEEAWYHELEIALHEESNDGRIAASTRWFVVCEPDYPAGSIQVFPARNGGITDTYPHQNHNSNGSKRLPWREGEICLRTTVRVLGRSGLDDEPNTAEHRLRWNLSRAVSWVQHAAIGSLQSAGDAFELPHLPNLVAGRNIAFNEAPDGLQTWRGREGHAGIVDLAALDDEDRILVARRFNDNPGWIEAPWGTRIKEAPAKEALWFFMPALPALTPWQAPLTWGELKTWAKSYGVDLLNALAPHLESFRNDEQHLLLLGFPIPTAVGGADAQVHWTAIQLPKLSRPGLPTRGFRDTTRVGHHHRDRHVVFADQEKIEWVHTENWSPHEYYVRGGLDATLRRQRFVIFGCGALGSVLAETLVRMGIVDLHLVDGEDLQGGNIARHRLGTAQVGQNKAIGLAATLNESSPHAKITADEHSMNRQDTSRMAHWDEADVIIDCTAAEDVIDHLQRIPWTRPKYFFSLSTAYAMERLFFYASYGTSFDENAFTGLIAPYLKAQQKRLERIELPRTGAGCWHPAFPGRYDQLLELVGRATHEIERLIITPPARPALTVLESHDAPPRPKESVPHPAEPSVVPDA